MKRIIKKRTLIGLIALFGLIIFCSGGYLLFKHFNMLEADKTNKQLQDEFAANLQIGTSAPEGYYLTMPAAPEGDTSPETTAAPVDPNSPVDFEGLMKQNPDVYSWIYIPDTKISFPVLQSETNPDFYLEHDVYKNYSFPGAIYSQPVNKRDYSDRVTVLYGHNMLNGTMFADLHKFTNQSFFDSHPYFYVYTKDRKLTYEVVSSHGFDDRSILGSHDFSDDKVFSEWLTAAQNPHSMYYTVRRDIKLDLNSKILVLSTCSNGTDARFLVQGVLISDEKTN